MVIVILVNGFLIELMVMEYINKQMEQYMKDIGEMINNMVKVKKNGLIILVIKGIIMMAKNKVKECTNGLIIVIMKEIG